MEIDIHYALVYHATNVNVIGMNWKNYGMAIWYDTRFESRAEARKRLRDMIWEDIFSENPQLVGTEIKYIESGELPVIDYSKM